MINIEEKKNCCGCSACVQACPKQCIDFKPDTEGFLFPEVNASVCIDCGLCERVCPILNKNCSNKPRGVYAAINENEQIRYESSSGGAFTALAEVIIKDGGVVFGAKFDTDWGVIHGYTRTIDGLKAFRGSKYVQSEIRDSYIKVRQLLRDGVKVLFSGTPCQIAGLKSFLNKEYANLTTLDVVCHGVPSPRVWKDYLDAIKRPKGVKTGKNTVLLSLKNKPVITGISFRDKLNGWKKFGFSVRYSVGLQPAEKFGFEEEMTLREDARNNLFMLGFLKNFYLRQSCHDCKFRSGRSGSDITLADFWGIQYVIPEIDDDKGVSLVLVNTDKGEKLLERTDNRI